MSVTGRQEPTVNFELKKATSFDWAPAMGQALCSAHCKHELIDASHLTSHWVFSPHYTEVETGDREVG